MNTFFAFSLSVHGHGSRMHGQTFVYGANAEANKVWRSERGAFSQADVSGKNVRVSHMQAPPTTSLPLLSSLCRDL